MEERAEDWSRYWRDANLLGFVESRDDGEIPERPGVASRTVVIDAIREDDLHSLARKGPEALHRYLPTAQLVISTAGPRERLPFQENNEGDWTRLRVGTGPLEAQVFRDIDGAESFLTAVEQLDSPARSEQATLRQVFSLDDVPDATPADLRHIPNVQADLVAVYQVGQGSCTAPCSSDGRPILYFDFGGGCLANARTYPPHMRYCFTDDQPVILSHWDFDHWFAATKHDVARQVPWFAPKQPIGPRTRKFAASLPRLRIVPAVSLPYRTAHAAFVACSGSTRNDSGIAAYFTVGGKPILNRIVLCPGDASFDYVPDPNLGAGVNPPPLAGLVATHHGSAHLGARIPRPAHGGAVAFSFGTGNTFHHPASSARSSYRNAGWVVQVETPGGHIALGGPARSTPCRGRCSLATTQP